MCTCTCINHICIKFFYLLFQNFRQKMDYFKEIKSSLEENDCLKVFKSLNNDQDFFSSIPDGSNILLSNNSFLFIYLEQAATILAHSLNVLCKSGENSLVKQYQVIYF